MNAVTLFSISNIHTIKPQRKHFNPTTLSSQSHHQPRDAPQNSQTPCQFPCSFSDHTASLPTPHSSHMLLMSSDPFLPSCLSSIPAPNDTSKCQTSHHPDPTKPGSANTSQVTRKSGSARGRRKIKIILTMRLENEDVRTIVVSMMIEVCNRSRDRILAWEEEGG
jgi:hypothetical protein